tara:strand:+ start:75 stop:497 length:423 start_codon:yes stop_codon:yes gene_type:complete
MTIKSRANEILRDFALFNSWEEKYEFLIELGDDLEKMPKKMKSKQTLISGCQSKVWLFCEKINNKLYFHGDSDALITRGIVALIVRLYSGAEANEVVNYKNDVFEKIKLSSHLSMTRANGLALMIKQIEKYGKKHALEDE